MYSQTWPPAYSDYHFGTHFQNIKLPLNNDHLSTTKNLMFQGWSLYTYLTVVDTKFGFKGGSISFRKKTKISWQNKFFQIYVRRNMFSFLRHSTNRIEMYWKKSTKFVGLTSDYFETVKPRCYSTVNLAFFIGCS